MDKVNVKRKKVTITLIIVFLISLIIALVWMYNTGNFITEKYTVTIFFNTGDYMNESKETKEIIESNDEDAIIKAGIYFKSYMKVYEDMQVNNPDLNYTRYPDSYVVNDSDGNIIYLSNK